MILKNVEKKESNAAAMTVTVEPGEFEKALQSVYLKNKKDIYIPGFRKGKAPRQVIEGMYGKEVFYEEAFDTLAPDAFTFGLEESELKIVGRPSIGDFGVEDDNSVRFVFNLTTYPEVTLGDYKGLHAVKKSEKVGEEAVDAEIEAVRKRNARMVDVERAAETGDTVDIDFTGYLEGEPFEGGSAEGHSLELGSGSFVPGFEEQLVGMSAGEEKDINITFPEDYAENLAGKDVVFHVVCNEVSAPEYPELDDEFAKDVSEFDTFAEYRESVKSGLQEGMDKSSDAAFRDAVIRKACENMTVDIPPVMVEDKVDDFLRNFASQYGMYDPDMTREQLMRLFGMNEESLNISMRPAAQAQVETEILLEAVAEAEGLDPDQAAIDAYCEKSAEDMGAKPEDLKNYFDEDFLKNEARRQMAMDLIIDSAVADEPSEEEENAEEAPASEEGSAE